MRGSLVTPLWDSVFARRSLEGVNFSRLSPGRGRQPGATRSSVGFGRTNSDCGAREVEMANRTSGKRRSGIIALIAVLAAIAAGSTASAAPGASGASASASAAAWSFAPGFDASWAEASWAEN